MSNDLYVTEQHEPSPGQDARPDEYGSKYLFGRAGRQTACSAATCRSTASGRHSNKSRALFMVGLAAARIGHVLQGHERPNTPFKLIDILVGNVKVSLNAATSLTPISRGHLPCHRTGTLMIDSTHGWKPPTDLTFTGVPQSLDEVKLASSVDADVNYAMGGDESSACDRHHHAGSGVEITGGAYIFDLFLFAPEHFAGTTGCRPGGPREPCRSAPTACYDQPGRPGQKRRPGALAKQRRTHRLGMERPSPRTAIGIAHPVKVKGTGRDRSLASPAATKASTSCGASTIAASRFGKAVNHTFNDNLAGNPRHRLGKRRDDRNPTGSKTTLDFRRAGRRT